MCAINGIFAFNTAAGAPEERELILTRDHMARRGPDGSDAWWSSDRRVGLGHRRLAIIDLSPGGAQPMTSACGRYVVVYNGEIYNYPALRCALEAEGRVFRSSSDTEVLLHLYELRGKAMVGSLRGMFALAIWDNLAQTLFLARDPYGIKPLYTSNDGWTFRFASQVKALLRGGRVSSDPEPAGVVGFHLWGSVPEPFTLYRDVSALPAGHYQIVDAAGAREPQSFCSIAGILSEGAAERISGQEIAVHIRDSSQETVKAHLLADVEVGIFLSAGIDSGAMLGLMRDAGQSKIRAITLAFEEFVGTGEDEAPLAAEVARTFEAEHLVRVIGQREFELDLPAILDAMDQPSIDGVNTWFVAKAAREAGLKVALSGLGGDEILGGYPSFRDIPTWTRRLRGLSAIPGLGRTVRGIGAALGLGYANPKALGLLEYGGTYPGAYLLRRGLFLPYELERVLSDRTFVRDGLRRLSPMVSLAAMLSPDPKSPMSRVAALESAQYMRNQLLRDADWAGMAHGLEIRTPFVDTTFARAIAPICPHLSHGAGKRALAAAPSRALPQAITDRAKTGFGVPTGAWMASHLKLDPALQSRKGHVSRAWGRAVFESFDLALEHQPDLSALAG